MREPAYELFDHTADAGVRAFGTTLPELYEQAARGLYATIGDLQREDAVTAPVGVAATPSIASRDVSWQAEDPAYVLRDFLAELLHEFECNSRLLRNVSWETLEMKRLSATLEFGAIDLSRSEFFREVKAVTYHELKLVRHEDGFMAEFIVDI